MKSDLACPSPHTSHRIVLSPEGDSLIQNVSCGPPLSRLAQSHRSILNDLSMLGDATLALRDIGCGFGRRGNARQISDGVGANLDDCRSAGGGGTSQVKSALYVFVSHVHSVVCFTKYLLARSDLVHPGGRETRTWLVELALSWTGTA